MNRRFFLALPIALMAAGAASAGETLDYTDGVIEEALASGKAVLVDYAADWCSTCAAQERQLEKLRAENPAYDENIVFVRVDWDVYGRKPVSTDRKIPRRSTLVMLKGDAELGRVVAQTSEKSIKELLDLAG